jgi:AraC family transcriptional regulator
VLWLVNRWDKLQVTMAAGVADLLLTQKDGEPPAVLASGCAPGEHGLAVFKLRLQGRVHLGLTSPARHFVWFQLSDIFIECRRETRIYRESVPTGSLAICLADVDCSADAAQGTEAIGIAIEPSYLALAAAEESALGARLIERICGRDAELLRLAHILVSECSENYPNGALHWSDVACEFIEGLLVRHTSERKALPRDSLTKDVLGQIRDYIIAHLDETIEVTALAEIAGRSPFHFTRIFARSVGLTPHRYVVHLRLQRARELISQRRSGLAEIAASTGFSDQSHLARWVRRVNGVSLTQLMS